MGNAQEFLYHLKVPFEEYLKKKAATRMTNSPATATTLSVAPGKQSEKI